MPGLQCSSHVPKRVPSPGWHDHRQRRQNDRGLCQGQTALPVCHLCQVLTPREHARSVVAPSLGSIPSFSRCRWSAFCVLRRPRSGVEFRVSPSGLNSGFSQSQCLGNEQQWPGGWAGIRGWGEKLGNFTLDFTGRNTQVVPREKPGAQLKAEATFERCCQNLQGVGKTGTLSRDHIAWSLSSQ